MQVQTAACHCIDEVAASGRFQAVCLPRQRPHLTGQHHCHPHTSCQGGCHYADRREQQAEANHIDPAEEDGEGCHCCCSVDERH